MTDANLHPYLIGIAGPSGSGKSTVCYDLASQFANVTLVQMDDFYRDADDVPVVGGVRDWDCPSALDLDAYISALQSLREGRETRIPVYRKNLSRRVGWRTVSPQEVIVSEGLFVYHAAGAREAFDLRLFLSVPEGIQLDRRRGRQPDFDQNYFEDVILPSSRRFVEPTRAFAHHVIETSGPMEDISGQVIKMISRYATLKEGHP